jgi:hypothetical protein
VGRLLGDPEVWDDSPARPRRRCGATHDPEVVKLCDRVVRLVDGRPVELDPDAVDGPAA